MYLILAIAALFIGPLLYRAVERNPKRMDALDAFIFVVIGGVVLFHMLPDIFSAGGPWALVFLVLGLAVPTIVEHTFHKIARHAHAGALLFAAIGLGIHGMTDGAAIAEATSSEHQSLLAAGVILHRLPVGLTIWWLLRPHFGSLIALLVLIGISLSTLVGHSVAEHWLGHLHGPAMAWFEALVVGTILHVVFHRPYHEDHAHQDADDETERNNWWQGVGSLIGVVALLAIMMPYWLGTIEHNHGHGHEPSQIEHGHAEQRTEPSHLEHSSHDHSNHDHSSHVEAAVTPLAEHSSSEVLHRLLDLSLAVAPWLLLAYLLAAAVNFLLPLQFAVPRQQDASDNPIKQALKGAVAGLPLPICVPNASHLYNQLLRHGSGQTYALAFLVASPLLGIDALLLTWGLLGSEWAIWRLLVTFVFSLLMALAIGYWLRQQPIAAQTPVEASHPNNWRTRMQQAIRHGYAHLIDHTAPWVIAGLIAAAILPSISGLADLPVLPALLILAVASLPLHLCATGMTPLLAVLLIAGLPPSFALVLLLLGPVTNLTLMRLLAKLHGKTSAHLITATMVVVTLLLVLFIPYWPASELELGHEHSQNHAEHWWQYASLLAVLVLYCISLLRRGARAFVAELLPTTNGHQHSHSQHNHHH